MAGFRLNLQDLVHILRQIKIAENHAATGQMLDLQGNPIGALVPWGLRTVSGQFNNLTDTTAGSADQTMPQLLTPTFDSADINPRTGLPTSYAQTSGSVYDAEPRVISNLIADQSPTNPVVLITALTAAGSMTQSQAVTYSRSFSDQYQALLDAREQPGANIASIDAQLNAKLDELRGHGLNLEGNSTGEMTVVLPNVMTDLTAPFNGFMTLFGQFFDHGLDHVQKGGSGTVYVPLQPDDPLYVAGSPTNFMVLTRATNGPGADGILGTADDVRAQTNATTPWVDLNQLYASHEAHQVFLREYVLKDGRPVATGRMLEGEHGGPPTWADVKLQAASVLGIRLTDADAVRVPLVATDLYGNFEPGANGFPQLVTEGGLVQGRLASPVNASSAIATGHAFLDDIAHSATPGTVDHDRNPTTAAVTKTADADLIAGNAIPVNGFGVATTYDNELLDAHYIVGDGRGNENIGLTAVHHLFHSEHNQRIYQIKNELLTSGDLGTLNEYLLEPVASIPTGTRQIDGLEWNGERLFQAARFATEMWYQHFVFEEFARTVSPDIDPFVFSNTVTIDPSIVAEFANVVYRFGHSMLNETVDRLAADGQTWDSVGLIEAFLNPLEFEASGVTADVAAGAIIRGMTRQIGNEIDEFVTSALRNNLVGLPLDLATLNIARGRETGTPSLNEARAEFFEQTGDARLAPYTSWAQFSQYLKNPASIINFVAAYGTHTTIVAATTADAKRDAAMLLVLGGVGAPRDRIDFLNARGAWAPTTTQGASLGGLNDVDFWIGGLAEKKMAFSGMLGSTFNFVFEVQLEKLQAADRFYYLSRTQGMNLLNQLENDSFANLVKRNTDLDAADATHLPNSIFRTPAFIFEMDIARQGHADPEQTDVFLGGLGRPLVIREDRNADGLTDYLEYTGSEHSVLGGTNRDDIIVGGEGDDTIWGDGGNDRLEGGFGVDSLKGGDGDDILTDSGTDTGAGEVFHGDGGNDVINPGQGLDLVFGGTGQDFVFGGGDSKTLNGMEGNDFLSGPTASSVLQGAEGDDWLEGGNGSAGLDYLAGDNSELFFNSEIIGHDVMDGRAGDTDYDGESGDDIMILREGIQRSNGMAGFDWVINRDATTGQTVDLGITAFANQQNFILRDRNDLVEGASGSQFDDHIIGRNEILGGLFLGRAANPTPGASFESYANTLLQSSVDRIAGFSNLVNHLERVTFTPAGTDKPVTAVVLDPSFVVRDANGNVIDVTDPVFGIPDVLIGGGGNDVLQGGTGNDIIDGDRHLVVRIAIADPANPNATADSMTGQVYNNVTKQTLYGGRTLDQLMMDRTLNPGQLSIVREILDTDPNNSSNDVAVFSRTIDEYSFSRDTARGIMLVVHSRGSITGDGTDRIINIETLRFSDGNGGTTDYSYAQLFNVAATGSLAVDLATSGTNAVLTLAPGTITDADLVSPDNPTGAITSANMRTSWSLVDPVTGVATLITGTGNLSVRADGALIAGATPVTGQIVRGFVGAQDLFGYIDGVSKDYNLIVGTAAGETLTGLNNETLGDAIHGLAGNDIINGQRGADLIDGGDGNDRLTGGEGNDVVRGGNGDDTLVVTRDDGNDTYVGGAGVDTINTTASDAAMNVNLHGGFVSSAETGTDSIATVENVVTGRGADVIALNALANTVNAGDGNDTVTVRSDILRDVIAGGEGSDTIDYRFYTTALTIDLSVATSVVVGSGSTEASSDTITGFENATSGSGADTLRGSAAANTLIAGAGNDTVIGGAGNDNLQGGDGNDSLQGDAGADTIATGAGLDTIRYLLVTDSAGLSVDTITDFARGSDRIDLSAIDASTAARGDQAFQFIGTNAFTSANQNGSIRYAYDAATNRTTIQISNDADTASEMEIVLVGQVALTATDFVL